MNDGVGMALKLLPAAQHWSVDGVDGFRIYFAAKVSPLVRLEYLNALEGWSQLFVTGWLRVTEMFDPLSFALNSPGPWSSRYALLEKAAPLPLVQQRAWNLRWLTAKACLGDRTAISKVLRLTRLLQGNELPTRACRDIRKHVVCSVQLSAEHGEISKLLVGLQLVLSAQGDFLYASFPPVAQSPEQELAPAVEKNLVAKPKVKAIERAPLRSVAPAVQMSTTPTPRPPTSMDRPVEMSSRSASDGLAVTGDGAEDLVQRAKALTAGLRIAYFSENVRKPLVKELEIHLGLNLETLLVSRSRAKSTKKLEERLDQSDVAVWVLGMAKPPLELRRGFEARGGRWISVVGKGDAMQVIRRLVDQWS